MVWWRGDDKGEGSAKGARQNEARTVAIRIVTWTR